MGEEFHTISLKELGKGSPDAALVPDVIKIPSKGFSEKTGRRVFYEGGWYLCKGTEDGMDILDKIPAAVLRAEQEAAQAEEDKRVQEKGHKCWDFVQHDFDPRTSLGDYYYCTVCDEVLQVG